MTDNRVGGKIEIKRNRWTRDYLEKKPWEFAGRLDIREEGNGEFTGRM